MNLHLTVVGYACIGLALVHIVFPAYFDWKQDLKPLRLINRQLMYVHTFFVALVVLLIGILCVSSPDELLGTELGHRVALGLGIFWGLRLLFQFFVYSPTLWRGKRLETSIHIIFSLLWTYFTMVFFWVYRS